MNKINDGGAAFPCPMSEQTILNQDSAPYQGGMTLRDYFAIHCLPVSRSVFPDGLHGGWAALAEHAYNLADEMLKARQR